LFIPDGPNYVYNNMAAIKIAGDAMRRDLVGAPLGTGTGSGDISG